MSALLKILFFMLGLSLASVIEARPGGGHSSHSSRSSSHSSSSRSSSSHSSSSHSTWSSHSSSSNSGSQGHGSGSADLEDLMIILAVLLIIILVIYVISKFSPEPKVVSSAPTSLNRSKGQVKLKQQLDLLKQADPNFSGILFLDFATSLYYKFYSYSNRPEFTYLQPFLASSLQTISGNLKNKNISEIVINGIRWLDISASDLVKDKITLEFDANYTAQALDSRARYTSNERWQFRRRKGVQSLLPDKMRSVCCPHCGAPVAFNDSGSCKHCGEIVETGAAQWYLANRTVLSQTSITTKDLVSYSQEQGTALPTITQVDFKKQCEAFAFRHNESWEKFREHFTQAIVKPYFLSIYQHWSKRTWEKARHLLSDRLYESNQFWLNLYHEYNYINRLDDLKIENVQLVKVESDRFYEAITARIFAACYDYTTNAQGKVIGGSSRRQRHYSEYWTFVRYNRPDPHQASTAFDLTTCPQCGAPADNMGQAAICGYCDSKISTGEFSWVLYMMTQDEAYAG